MGLFSKKRHVGININDRSIEFISIDTREHPPVILSYARAELAENSIVRGSILDEHTLRKTLKKLKGDMGLYNDTVSATVSISEYLIFPISLSIEGIPKDQLYASIREKAAERIPLDADEQTYFVIKESLKQHSAVIYVLNRHIIQYYQEILAKEKIEIEFIEPESVAAARFLLPAFHDQNLTFVCDIGKTTTQLISLSKGMPLHSDIIPIGADRLMRGTVLDPQTVEELEFELHDRLSRLHAMQPYTLHCIGGGSLLGQLVDAMQTKKIIMVPGVPGTPLKHPGLSDEELRLYAHAIGNALRGTNGVGGSELIDARTLQSSSKPVLSLAQFKNRFVVLSAIFIILISVLVVLLFTNRENDSEIPANLNTTYTQPHRSSLDVFSFAITPDNTDTFTRQDQAIEHTMTVQATATNEAGESVLGEQDIKQTESILREQIRNELQQSFESQFSDTTRVIFAVNATDFELTSIPALGERAENAEITVRGTGYAFAVPESALQTIASDHLAAYSAITNIEIHIPDYNVETNQGTAFIRTTFEH